MRSGSVLRAGSVDWADVCAAMKINTSCSNNNLKSDWGIFDIVSRCSRTSAGFPTFAKPNPRIHTNQHETRERRGCTEKSEIRHHLARLPVLYSSNSSLA